MYEKEKRRQFTKFTQTLLQHQIDTVESMEDNDKLTIALPTGTGKTRIIHTDILNNLYKPTNKNIFKIYVISSHRLLLNSQHFYDLFNLFKYYTDKIVYAFVGSSKINLSNINNTEEYIDILKTYKLNFNDILKYPQNSKELKQLSKETKENHKNLIIITTYNSLGKLNKLKIDSFYADEAHFLATPKQETQFKTAYKSINSKRNFFFTATPRDAANDELKAFENNDGTNDLFLMNNKDIFGERVGIPFAEAIKRTLIVKPYIHIIEPTDFKINSDYTSIENYIEIINDGFKKHQEIINEYNTAYPKKNLKAKILVKCPSVDEMWAIKNKLLNNNRTIFAGASRGEGSNGSYMINEKPYDKLDFLQKLKELKYEDSAIILHYDVLSEGIDVPGITGVMFLSKNLPTTPKILQTVGRSTRLTPYDRNNFNEHNIGKVENGIGWMKPKCAVILPILNKETTDVADAIAQKIITLREDFNFDANVIMSIGDDHAKVNSDTPNEELNQKTKQKPLFNLVESVIHKLDDLNSDKELAKLYINLTEINKKRFSDFEFWSKQINKLLNQFKGTKRFEYVIKYIYQQKAIEGKGIIYTPKEIRDRIINVSELKANENILIINNIEFINDLINTTNNITFISDDKGKNLLVKSVFNIKTIYIEDYKKINEKLENMKFDLIISNPPYNNGLDLKILKNIYNLGDRICFIHPATWLYDNKMKSKLFLNTRELVKEHFISATKVENANKIFGITLFTDTLITYIDKSKNGLNNKIYNFDKHGNSEIYKSLKTKILNYKNNLQNYVNVNIKTKKTYIGLSVMGCNTGSIKNKPAAFNSLISLKYANNKNQTDNNLPLKFGFNTLNEALNFKNYLKTKIVRFALSIYKINQHLDSGELTAVPYMPTYQHEWTDKMISKELNLTNEELRWAINWIPNYYEEDKEKYKKYEI